MPDIKQQACRDCRERSETSDGGWVCDFANKDIQESDFIEEFPYYCKYRKGEPTTTQKVD